MVKTRGQEMVIKDLGDYINSSVSVMSYLTLLLPSKSLTCFLK